MNFFKRVLSTVTGIIVFCALCVFGLIVLAFVFGSNSEDLVQVKPNSILELKLDFPIKDYAGKTEFKQYAFLNENKKNGLFDIIAAINYAATDDKIKGISISNNFINAGISQTQALRGALKVFKSSGKFVVAYADIFTQKDYYLSSIADTIYLNPSGMVMFKGLYTERLYFKDFQEKSGLKMEVVRLGKYKSAVEPFLANEMSDNNREQISVYLNSLWNAIKYDISEARNIPFDRLNSIADSLLARNANLAKSANIIDKIGYQDEYINGIKKAIGLKEADNLSTVTIKDYAEYAASKLSLNTSKNKIAVIYAQGNIIYGEGDQNSVGQIAMNKSLKRAREDKKVKAVVIRVNSPGGSALSSELIWREIELTKKVKPVIVSMGDMAASGGYYIACNADKIIAQPTTITGSIGVFRLLPNGKELAKNMGINAEQVSTNANTITYSFFESLNDEQLEFGKEDVLQVYDLFKARVAKGRGLTLEQVENVSQGRVWTGADAVTNGLVDELGGLDLALQRAAEASGIEGYKIKEFPVFEKDLDKVLEQFGLSTAKETILKEELGEANYKLLEEIKSMYNKTGIQLLFPFSTEIK